MDWQEIISEVPLGSGRERIRLLVNGRVQGVGFRPSVYRFAQESGVAGFVRNTHRGVVIEVEGEPTALHRFGECLIERSPPLARIDAIEAERVQPCGDQEFVIGLSEGSGSAETRFPVDTAVCDDCLREMRDRNDRRYRYPFINCTNCGPRFTIITGLPYDRPLTTMDSFEMGSFCSSQYVDPADRRFHAEPISCPVCGPRVTLIDATGGEMPGDAIVEARRLIRSGRIVAVKGLGGYHLACRATDPEVVERLRRRKRRPAKPFALMFRDMETVERHCVVGETERALLCAPEAPIVLLRRRGAVLPGGIAPRNGYLGAFLPYTPLHHLLMEPFEVLVMTSANFTDEPLISTEAELNTILGTIADAAIVHNRRIAHKCDDSISFVPAGQVVPIRRARGFVPEPVRMPVSSARSILAVGAQEKGTFALSRGGEVFLSPHLGDLGDYRSQKNYRSELEEFKRILAIEPEAIVCDMHPDYFTTRLAGALGISPVIPVQHHHAHAVSVMVEHGLEEPVIAVSFDGTGYGTDGTLWGSEFLIARYTGFERLAHLKNLPLPGGEAAIREPWRMALVHLSNLLGAAALDVAPAGTALFRDLPAASVLALIRQNVNAPLTSSMGRLFDAVGFMLGCGERVSYEAEAAVALEALALEGRGSAASYEFAFAGGVPLEIDPAPVVAAILRDIERGTEPAHIAAAFHRAVAGLVATCSTCLAERYGCRSVVVSGGVFQNRLLCEELIGLRGTLPVEFYLHEIVPPNDGGVSLGQVQVGAAMIEKGLV